MKKIIILIIIIFVIAASSTLAFFIWNNNSNQDIAVDLKLNGLDAYINYNKGTDVLTGTLLPSTDYSGGISTEIELWKSSSAENRTIYGHIYLDITTIGTNLVNEEALKWVITSNGKVLNTGNFVGQTEGIYVTLDINIPLSTTKQLFQIYILLDESMEINDQIEGETLSTKVRAEATEVIYPEVGAKYVSSLIYYDNEMINNDDPDGNIRYMGKDPDNYVLFNNELWRIIGIFDVKSSEDGPYWNRTTGTCPYGKNGGTKSCDFSKIGLTNQAKELISDAMWNLGGHTTVAISTKDFYYAERSDNVFENHETFWVGEIGLIYPSDYGYATSGGITQTRNGCLVKALYQWNTAGYEGCADNDYIYSGINTRLLTNQSSNTYNVFMINNKSMVYNGSVSTTYYVMPSAYLKSSVILSGGSGTSTNPYTLSINN